jgi:hypothetical protein
MSLHSVQGDSKLEPRSRGRPHFTTGRRCARPGRGPDSGSAPSLPTSDSVSLMNR